MRALWSYPRSMVDGGTKANLRRPSSQITVQNVRPHRVSKNWELQY